MKKRPLRKPQPNKPLQRRDKEIMPAPRERQQQQQQGQEGPGGRRYFYRRKRQCRFCSEKIDYIDFKDVSLLQGFVPERGRILPRRITGTCAWHQRKL